MSSWQKLPSKQLSIFISRNHRFISIPPVPAQYRPLFSVCVSPFSNSKKPHSHYSQCIQLSIYEMPSRSTAVEIFFSKDKASTHMQITCKLDLFWYIFLSCFTKLFVLFLISECKHLHISLVSQEFYYVMLSFSFSSRKIFSLLSRFFLWLINH